MNTRIFMDYYHEIDFPSLFARAVESDDDVGTTLRIHLLCERMVEAWICACCDCQDLFGRDKNKLLIECNTKISMAGNLGIPPELMKSLKTINSMRNDLAHNPSIQSIADSRIIKAAIGDVRMYCALEHVIQCRTAGRRITAPVVLGEDPDEN